MRYELVDGNPRLITVMANDGWKLVATFPNPYPEPYFMALMSLEHPRESEYDLFVATERLQGREVDTSKWDFTINAKNRREKLLAARDSDY